MQSLMADLGSIRPVAMRRMAACALTAVVFAAVVATAAQPVSPPEKRATTKASGSAASDRNVVARVNDKPIYKNEVDQVVSELSRGQQLDPSSLATVQASALERLIGQRLFIDFLEAKKLIATEEEMRSGMAKVREQAKSQKLEKEFISNQAVLRNQLANQLSIQKFVAEYGKPELIEQYFERNKRHFDGTELRVSHLLLRPTKTGDAAESARMMKEAQRIKAEIEAGKLSFADAAKQYSAGPSKSEGGDLGFINRTGPMMESFSRTAFELAEGKVSDPVMTSFGIHLITVTEAKAGDKSLVEVRDDIMPHFTQWLIAKLIERELKTAKVEFTAGFPHFKPGTSELEAEK